MTAKIPEIPKNSWLWRAFEYVKVRTKLPDWCAFWTLFAYCGASLQDRFYVNWAPKRIFPNFPLLLVMPSGRGKTGAMNVCRPLFENCLPFRIPEDCTAEAALKEFAQRGRSPSGNSVCVWEVPEMADIFGRKDYQQGMIARVTRLLDAPKDRDVARMSSDFHLRLHGYAVMNWIAGTTFRWLRGHVDEAVVAGGFLPRLVNIYTSESPKYVPNPMRDKEIERTLNSELYQMLAALPIGTSPIPLDEEQWNPISKRAYEALAKTGDEDRASFISRREENVLRLALILAIFGSCREKPRQNETPASLMMAKDLEEISTTLSGKYPTAEKAVQRLEAQGVALGQDLLSAEIDPILRRVRGFLADKKSSSFRLICKNLGITAEKLSVSLRDLERQGEVTWNHAFGEKGLVKYVEDPSEGEKGKNEVEE